MALLNRFSKLNDRAGTGIFTFIVTKSVTRDFHRDATTKDFCFGYHRWAISFQRPTEKVLGVHLLLRNPSPSTACVVDFTLTLLNREHFSQNKVYTKRQAKFTITNPMQVSSGRLFNHLLLWGGPRDWAAARSWRRLIPLMSVPFRFAGAIMASGAC